MHTARKLQVSDSLSPSKAHTSLLEEASPWQAQVPEPISTPETSELDGFVPTLARL